MPWPRALVFTANAPPSSAASAQVIERLISGADEHFGFVHRADGIPRTKIISAPVIANQAFRVLSRSPILWRFEQLGWYHAAIREGVRQAALSNWDVVLACHPNMAFALAAAKVARLTNLPLVLYLMDLFAESRVNPVERIWARVVEKKLMKQASTVICLTEGVKKYYSQKYTISSVLIPHSVTEPEIAEAIANKPNIKVELPIIVAYAGDVYQARLDSLVVVKQAIEKLNAQGYPVQLLILGNNDPARLTDWDLGGAYVNVCFIKDRSEFMEQLRHSDILLSTIAFKSAYPLQDQTCFPTKTLDYFLAGKPILIVAPGNVDYVTYMKLNSSAMIVTALDSNIVAKCMFQLVTDISIRKQLVNSGFMLLDVHRQKTSQVALKKLLLQSVGSSCVKEDLSRQEEYGGLPK